MELEDIIYRIVKKEAIEHLKRDGLLRELFPPKEITEDEIKTMIPLDGSPVKVMDKD